MNKQEALEKVNALVEHAHISAQEEARSIFIVGKERFAKLSIKCLELKEKIIVSDDADPLLIDNNSVEAELMSFERELAKLKGKARHLLGLAGVLAFVLLATILWKFGGHIQDSLLKLFGFADTGKYIILGICGAVVFFVTEGITKKEQLIDGGELTLRRLIAHIAFAVIIPVVIVVIFFSNDAIGGGTSALDANIPALLCFAAGYSSKLVVMLLNKIVEKGEQIINAI